MDFNALKIFIQDFFNQKHKKFSNKTHLAKTIAWLKRAQDASPDGGVSAWFSLINGWSYSYIETTGYIIDTFLAAADYLHDPDLKQRAISMADFLLEMQDTQTGGFRTHTPAHKKNSPPTVFNTGQNLLGLTSIYQSTKQDKYLTSAIKAADFLCKIQEQNGSWIKYTYGLMPHAYHSRVAWSLLKVYKLTNKKKYKTATLKNLDWVVSQQQDNGWFRNNQLPLPNQSQPFTHIISYAIEGLLWSGILLKNKPYINAADKGAQPLLNYYLQHGSMPGSFNNDWQSQDRYSCLTGNAQLVLVWLKLLQVIKDKTAKKKYQKAGLKLLSYLKSTHDLNSGNLNIRGGVKGSQPIYGDLLANEGYCRMAYPNWAAKFLVDALLEAEKCP